VPADRATCPRFGPIRVIDHPRTGGRGHPNWAGVEPGTLLLHFDVAYGSALAMGNTRSPRTGRIRGTVGRDCVRQPALRLGRRETQAVQRIIVVGPPGSGKTTVSRGVAAALDCPHVELDGLWWDAGWSEAGGSEFRSRVAAVTPRDRWVVDGNYFSSCVRDLIWPVADTVVWLDQPRRVTVPRVVWRTANRALRRTELWNGNRERLALDRDSMIRFAWREHPNYHERYAGLADDADLAHLDWVHLRAPHQVREWMASLTSATPND
jgi:adenylate kinase family enzyme